MPDNEELELTEEQNSEAETQTRWKDDWETGEFVKPSDLRDLARIVNNKVIAREQIDDEAKEINGLSIDGIDYKIQPLTSAQLDALEWAMQKKAEEAAPKIKSFVTDKSIITATIATNILFTFEIPGLSDQEHQKVKKDDDGNWLIKIKQGNTVIINPEDISYTGDIGTVQLDNIILNNDTNYTLEVTPNDPLLALVTATIKISVLYPDQHLLTWSGINWTGGWYANSDYSGQQIVTRYEGHPAYFRATPNKYFEQTISGRTYKNGDYFEHSIPAETTTDQNVTLIDAIPSAYTLNIVLSDTDNAIKEYTVIRTSSPIGEAATGAIADGANIYGNDTLVASVIANEASHGNWDYESIADAPVVIAVNDEFARIEIENSNELNLICEFSRSSTFDRTETVFVSGNDTAYTGTLVHNTKYYFRFKYQQKRDIYTYSVSKSWATLTVDDNETIEFIGNMTTGTETGNWIYSQASECIATQRPTIKVLGNHCTIKVGDTQRVSGWEGSVDWGTTIKWIAAGGYAYQINDAPSTEYETTVTGNGDYEKNVYYGYYTITPSNCIYDSGDAAGYYVLGTTPTTKFKASAGWSFGGLNTGDISNNISPSSSVPCTNTPSPEYCNITVGSKYSSTILESQTILAQIGTIVNSSNYYNLNTYNEPTGQYTYEDKTTNSVTVANTSTEVYTVYSIQTERYYYVNFTGTSGEWTNSSAIVSSIYAPYSAVISLDNQRVDVGSDYAIWTATPIIGKTATTTITGASGIVGTGKTVEATVTYYDANYELWPCTGTGKLYEGMASASWKANNTDTVKYATYGTENLYLNYTCADGYYSNDTNPGPFTLNSNNFGIHNDYVILLPSKYTTPSRIGGTLLQGILPAGVASITCYRKQYNGSSFTQFTSGAIYYGDMFYWEATASTGYSNPTVSYGSAINYYTWHGDQGEEITSVSASGLSAGGIKTCSITLNKNGGLSDGSCIVTYNSSTIGSWVNARRTGYTCNGYYTATSGGTKVITAYGTLVSGVSGYTDVSGKWIWDNGTSLTLYAQWELDTYYITLSNNFGTWKDSNNNIVNEPLDVNYGETITVSNNTIIISNKGTYTFTASVGRTFNSFNNIISPIEDDQTIEVIAPLNKYTISLDNSQGNWFAGGDFIHAVTSITNVPYGSTLSVSQENTSIIIYHNIETEADVSYSYNINSGLGLDSFTFASPVTANGTITPNVYPIQQFYQIGTGSLPADKASFSGATQILQNSTATIYINTSKGYEVPHTTAGINVANATIDSYTSSAKSGTLIISNPTDDVLITVTLTLIPTYAVTMAAGNGVNEVYSSTNANATSGNISDTTYESGTTVYIFAKMQQHYRPNIPSAYCIDGNTSTANSIWRIASQNVTSAWNYGTITGTNNADILISYGMWLDGSGYYGGGTVTLNTTLGNQVIDPHDFTISNAPSNSTLYDAEICVTGAPSYDPYWTGTVYADYNQEIGPSLQSRLYYIHNGGGQTGGEGGD